MIESFLAHADAIGIAAVGLWVCKRMIERLDGAIARIAATEQEVAVLKARETADYNRLSGIEARLKALETCQSGMKADLAAIRAILEARPGKTPTPGSK